MAHSTGAGARDLHVRKGFFLLYSQIMHGPSQHSTPVEGEHSPTWGVINSRCPTEPLEQVGLGVSASILDPSKQCSTLTVFSLLLLPLSPLTSMATVSHHFLTCELIICAVPSSHSFSALSLPPTRSPPGPPSLCRAVLLSSRHGGLPHPATTLARPASADPLLSLVQFWSPDPVDILKIYLDGPPNCI